MSYVLHRNLRQTPPTAVSGCGLWVTDGEGREYLDAVSGGAAVSCLGHSEPRVSGAIAEQLARLPYYHNSFFTTEPAEQLAEALIADAPEPGRVMYCSGGSEAVEAALKLVRQYWVERGRPQKQRIIARRQSYHGATIGALSVGGNLARREVYAPLLFDAHLIEPCYPYRHRRPEESAADYGRRAADELERAILELGPENVGAFICEPVVGATLGCVPAAPGYLVRVREICDRHDVLLVFDEIMCGSGRTGHAYACLEDGVWPDLLTLAKGMGGGFQPVGAVIVAERVVDALRGGSGALRHGYTYMAHATACAAALAVHRVVAEENLLTNVRARGEQLMGELHQRLSEHPHVGEIRGRGLFVGLELVAEREAKRPFAPELGLYARIKRTALERGLLVYPGGGTVDGHRGDHVLLAPAYIASAQEISEIVRRLAGTLEQAFAELPTDWRSMQ